MAVNNNNSPIPKEAIEGAAGINDKFSIKGLEFDQEKKLVVQTNVCYNSYGTFNSWVIAEFQ